MLFNSIQFLLFLPVVVLLYWLLPERWRLPMLLVASYGFYMSWMPLFILLIIPMTLFNWLWGDLLARSPKNAKLLLGLGVSANLLTLGIFKYSDFVARSLGSLVGLATRHNPDWAIRIILPLGISFFTFEFIHYLFEIYRGQKPIKSFVLFALFAAFFPTQIAGPIKRFPDFAAQMLEKQKLQLSYFDQGIPLIVIGLAKKLLLADNLSILVQMGLNQSSVFGAPETWLIAYAFTFQIYFDFSGYTDIARGSALLFGYHIPINFDTPYLAENIADFWRRWHISLSTWLRDYLFIPLGGSRSKRWATNRNLLITMTLGGLWHGAAWNFVLWGVYHGFWLVVHREFVTWRQSLSIDAFKSFCESRFYNLVSIVTTFNIVTIGLVIFRNQDLKITGTMIKRMLLLSPIFTSAEEHHFLLLKPLLPVVVPVSITIVVLLLITNLPLSIANRTGYFRRMPAVLTASYCAVLIFAMITFLPDDSRPFIYFQF